MKIVLFLALFLTLSATVLSQMAGGWSKVNLREAKSDARYQKALRTAIDGLDQARFMRKEGVKVKNAWRQVVAGMNYRFELSGLKYCTDDPITIESTVYCDLDNKCSMSCNNVLNK